MFEKKDLIRIESLTKRLLNNVVFNNLKIEDIIHLKADFEWIDGLKGRISEYLKNQEQNLRKAQLASNIELIETPELKKAVKPKKKRKVKKKVK